jgi:hypothetical protein
MRVRPIVTTEADWVARLVETLAMPRAAIRGNGGAKGAGG